MLLNTYPKLVNSAAMLLSTQHKVRAHAALRRTLSWFDFKRFTKGVNPPSFKSWNEKRNKINCHIFKKKLLENHIKNVWLDLTSSEMKHFHGICYSLKMVRSIFIKWILAAKLTFKLHNNYLLKGCRWFVRILQPLKVQPLFTDFPCTGVQISQISRLRFYFVVNLKECYWLLFD